jgi:hypothetical protein
MGNPSDDATTLEGFVYDLPPQSADRSVLLFCAFYLLRVLNG